MHLVMFDIDGTLVDTSSFEDDCFLQAVGSQISEKINADWSAYTHISDTGLVNQLIDNMHENDQSIVFQRIRAKFIQLVSDHLAENSAAQISGASAFIDYLKDRKDVVLAIATGGWRETAEMKLRSANIDFTDIALASSNDHFDRTQIMKIAQQRTGVRAFESKSYIGDGAWDKAASEKLGYNFILIGNNAVHDKKVNNFYNIENVISLIGLPR
ncbi:HAD family hydrolase [Arenicella sp.]|nr:HAD family hydrolase [Arenicella sp.]